MKKRILCFGDSNTWGYMVTGGRFPDDVRWPMRLQMLLGDEYTVIEEGFNCRTTVFDDVVVRVNPAFSAAMHIDTDESNASCAFGKVYGEILA